jgi:hypothetical protein
MTAVGYALLALGIVLFAWGVAGVVDRSSRSEDDWPLALAGLFFVVVGAGLVVV